MITIVYVIKVENKFTVISNNNNKIQVKIGLLDFGYIDITQILIVPSNNSLFSTHIN